MPEVKHYEGCNAEYPEKVPGEIAQLIQIDELNDYETMYTCVDCGAYWIERKKK